MGRIVKGVGRFILMVFRDIARTLLFLLGIILYVVKLLLLLFDLIFRVFVAFVRAGEP